MLVFSITVPVYGSSRTVSFTLNNLFYTRELCFYFSETLFIYRTNVCVNVISVDTHGLFPWFLQRIHKLMLQPYMIQCINNDSMRCMVVIISQTTKEIQSQPDGQ